jgi:hypothetical protein
MKALFLRIPVPAEGPGFNHNVPRPVRIEKMSGGVDTVRKVHGLVRGLALPRARRLKMLDTGSVVMYYLIRITVAIVTFGLGSGLAGLISPTPSNSGAVQRYHGRENRPVAPVDVEGVLRPEWVFVEKKLDWYQVSPAPEDGASVPPAMFERAHAHISIFYPSGKFAIVCCHLLRSESDPMAVRLDWNDGYRVYLGSWERKFKKIVTVANVVHSTQQMVDMYERPHLVGLWDLGDGDPSDQSIMRADGVPFVHLQNFTSLELLPSVVMKPVTVIM